MPLTKKSDSKGRLALGLNLANTTFLIEQKETGELVIKKAVVIPEREHWVRETPGVYNAVQQGLDEAKQKKFAADPLASNENMSWLDEVEE